VFFSLYFQTFWPKWLNFLQSFQNHFGLWPKNYRKKALQACGNTLQKIAKPFTVDERQNKKIGTRLVKPTQCCVSFIVLRYQGDRFRTPHKLKFLSRSLSLSSSMVRATIELDSKIRTTREKDIYRHIFYLNISTNVKSFRTISNTIMHEVVFIPFVSK